jgi:hypothetical protein
MLNKTICKRRFAVIDVGDNRKISYVTEFSQRLGTSKKKRVAETLLAEIDILACHASSLTAVFYSAGIP